MVNIADAIEVLAPNAVFRQDYLISDEGAGPVLAYWNTATLGTQPTPAQIAAVTPAQVATARTAKLRALAVALATNPDAPWKFVRAAFDVARDEVNILRQWETDFKVQVAASTSFADLKTRIATLPSTPQRTKAQFITAVVNRVNDGTVDT